MGTSNKGTEDRTLVDVSCRLDPNKDVQLKTLAKIWQGSRQPNLANKVIWTRQVWFATRYINIKIIINIIIALVTRCLHKPCIDRAYMKVDCINDAFLFMSIGL